MQRWEKRICNIQSSRSQGTITARGYQNQQHRLPQHAGSAQLPHLGVTSPDEGTGANRLISATPTARPPVIETGRDPRGLEGLRCRLLPGGVIERADNLEEPGKCTGQTHDAQHGITNHNKDIDTSQTC